MGPGPAELILCLLLAGACASCAADPRRIPPERVLPFTVNLLPVEPQEPEASDPGSKKAVTPAVFADPEMVTASLRRAFEDSGIFTQVVAPGAGAPPSDLELRVRILGNDFGPGKLQAFGAIFSTLTWLVVGHLSWFIDNRTFPQSEVFMAVEIRGSGGRAGRARTAVPAKAARGGTDPAADARQEPVFEDILPLKGLALNFKERSDFSRWFLDIILPPCVGDGDPRVSGESLAGRSMEFFATNEPDRILTNLPKYYFKIVGCFLAHDSDSRELVIVSKKPMVHIGILRGGAGRRELQEKDIDTKKVPPRETARLWRWLVFERGLAIGIQPDYHYYRIALDPEEQGILRIEATQRDVNLPVARWTIRTAPPALVTGGS